MIKEKNVLSFLFLYFFKNFHLHFVSSIKIRCSIVARWPAWTIVLYVCWSHLSGLGWRHASRKDLLVLALVVVLWLGCCLQASSPPPCRRHPLPLLTLIKSIPVSLKPPWYRHLTRANGIGVHKLLCINSPLLRCSGFKSFPHAGAKSSPQAMCIETNR